MKMRKYIKLQRIDKDFILKTFKISEVMLSYALNFDKKRGNSELAKKIRTLALQRGGVPVCELPVFETIHDANGMMRQEFLNGAVLVVDKNTGVIVITDKHGRTVRRSEENSSIERLYIEQEFAARL